MRNWQGSFKDENIVIGYDIVNEPAQAELAQYLDFSKAGIRNDTGDLAR